jgi:hypothetical protein
MSERPSTNVARWSAIVRCLELGAQEASSHGVWDAYQRCLAHARDRRDYWLAVRSSEAKGPTAA